jgi:hypothetical protein
MINRIDGIQLDIPKKGLRFSKIQADDLTRGQYEHIRDLRYRHYIRELVDSKPKSERVRDVAQVGAFVGQTTLKAMRDLNVLVEQGRRRKHQRYERQAIVLVSDENDELRAGFRYEDNVRSRILQDIEKEDRPSTRTERIKGAAEMVGKLYVPHPRLIKGRHFVAEEFFHDGTLPGIELVTVGVAVEDYHGDQPVAGYPFKEETAFRNDLRLMGLWPDRREPEHIGAFGPGKPLAEMERWSAKHLDDVRDNVHGIPGVSFAIEQAHATL